MKLAIAFASVRHSFVKCRETVWTSVARGLSWQVLIEADRTFLTHVVGAMCAFGARHCEIKLLHTFHNIQDTSLFWPVINMSKTIHYKLLLLFFSHLCVLILVGCG